MYVKNCSITPKKHHLIFVSPFHLNLDFTVFSPRYGCAWGWGWLVPYGWEMMVLNLDVLRNKTPGKRPKRRKPMGKTWPQKKKKLRFAAHMPKAKRIKLPSIDPFFRG